MASEARRRRFDVRSAEVIEMRRLRFGSQHPRVSMLQSCLGIHQPDGDLGPATAEELSKKQLALARRCDGIYTPQLDAQLGWNIFAAGA